MKQQSKFLSFVLRHNPASAGIVLDREGWALVSDILKVLSDKYGPFHFQQLQQLVDESDKKRFAFNSTGTKIRANQGHSIPVDLGLEPVVPPPVLYHGTKSQFLDSIFVEGLKPGSRQHVHLSSDIETALIVANRRSGENIILSVDTTELTRHPFYLSANGVWLTDHIPPQHLTIVPGE